jgi:hypothetical protein
MIQVCAKIGMTLDLAHLETVAYICMIEAIIKQDGNLRKISKNHKGNDGKE